MWDRQIPGKCVGSLRIGLRLLALTLICSTSALGHAQQTPTLPGGGRLIPGPNGTGLSGRSNLAQQRQLNQQNQQNQQNQENQQKPDDKGIDRRKDDADTAEPGAAGGEPGAGAPGPRQIGGAAPNVRVIGGGAQGGGAAKPRVQGAGAGAFEPFKRRPLKYDEVPDVGEPMSLTGPMPAMQFLDDISFATGWNIVAAPQIQTVNLQFWITDMKPKVALEILKFHDVYYKFDQETNMLFVMTEEEFFSKEYGDEVEAEFHVEHADIADIEAMAGNFLSPIGRLVTDPRTGTLFVFDTQDNIDAVETALKKLDVPLVPQSYHLSYIDAETLAESIETVLTERGTVQIDPRTNTIVVTDLPSRQSQIAEMVETLDRQLISKTWTIKYADVEAIAENVEVLVPEEMGTITINEDAHLLTISAIPERIDEVDKLIAEWDIKLDQVQIEAYLVSANTRIARKLGVDWSYFGEIGNTLLSTQFTNPITGSTDFNAGQLPAVIPLRNPITGDTINNIEGDPIARTYKGDNVSAVLHYLDSRGDVTILSQPRVTVQDGQEAAFENTESIPYVSATYETPRSVANPSGGISYDYRQNNQITFLDVGTILKVLPRITEEKNILLEISAEESTAEIITITASNQQNSVPQKRQNKADTIVRVHDGQTIVIGGLRQAQVNDTINKIPILGDLPIIKHAFRSKDKEDNNNELMIFLTCTIVDEFTQPEAERLARLNNGTVSEFRKDGRPFWERLADSVARGDFEIGVSIGQGGDLWSRGESVTMDDLERAFMKIGHSPKARVVIFKHPRADQAISIAVAELAMQADLKVEYDTRVTPFVPHYGGPEKPDPTIEEGTSPPAAAAVP